MRMLASCRTPADGGYTLLEILFVLVLIGLVGSLVVPRLGGLYDSLVLAGERDDLLNALRDLPREARNRGQSIDLGTPEGFTDIAAGLGEAWSVSGSGRLRYLPSGFCTGGQVRLEHRSGRAWTYVLNPPYCVPTEAPRG